MATSEEAVKIDEEFTAVLRKSPVPEGWTCLVWPDSVTFFGTRGLPIGKQEGDTVTVRPAERFRS